MKCTQTNKEWLEAYFGESVMAIPSSERAGSGKEWVQCPEGSHVARCVTLVDLGVQATHFGDKEQVYIGFEVYDHRVEWEKDGVQHEGPGLIGVTWTNNLYEEANLGKNLISWRGRPFTDAEKELFDLGNLLGVPCILTVIHNESKGKTYANIASITGIPRGLDTPPQETASIGYSPRDPDTFGNLSKLPEWLQKKANDGVFVTPEEEYVDDFGDQEIPF